MPVERNLWFNLKQIALFGLTGTLLGLIYISIVNGFVNLYPFLNGVVIGVLMGVLVGTFEIYLFHPRLQQYPFALMLSFRVVMYTLSIIAIILIVVTMNRAFRHDQGFFEAFRSEESRTYIFRGNFKTAIIFTFMAALIANFARLISLKIGRGILTDFILGAYHKPKQMERVFVLLQITNADYVLKHNEIETYHNFLNGIYRTMSIVAMNHRGYVYEYVDDHMLIYWKGSQKDWAVSLINFHNEAQAVMNRDEEYFKNSYGLIPTLVFSAHGGTVIQAEIGELKTEIVFHGDVLNTASRIGSVAKEEGKTFVISDYIFKRTARIESIATTSIGEFELRGKLQTVSLYAVTA